MLRGSGPARTSLSAAFDHGLLPDALLSTACHGGALFSVLTRTGSVHSKQQQKWRLKAPHSMDAPIDKEVVLIKADLGALLQISRAEDNETPRARRQAGDVEPARLDLELVARQRHRQCSPCVNGVPLRRVVGPSQGRQLGDENLPQQAALIEKDLSRQRVRVLPRVAAGVLDPGVEQDAPARLGERGLAAAGVLHVVRNIQASAATAVVAWGEGGVVDSTGPRPVNLETASRLALLANEELLWRTAW